MRTTQSGFTFIDILFVAAIAGIFAAIALPGFQTVLQRARRSEVLVAAVQVQGAQERLRAQLARYGSLAEIGVAAVTPAGHYALEIRSADDQGYELLATASGTQTRDCACRVMSLRIAGLDLIHTSGSDAAVANGDALNRRCWSL